MGIIGPETGAHTPINFSGTFQNASAFAADQIDLSDFNLMAITPDVMSPDASSFDLSGIVDTTNLGRITVGDTLTSEQLLTGDAIENIPVEEVFAEVKRTQPLSDVFDRQDSVVNSGSLINLHDGLLTTSIDLLPPIDTSPGAFKRMVSNMVAGYPPETEDLLQEEAGRLFAKFWTGNFVEKLTTIYEVPSFGWTVIFQDTIPEKTLLNNNTIGYLSSRGEAVEGVRTAVITDMDTFSHDPWDREASWLGEQLNRGADAGDVYHEEGLVTYTNLYANKGLLQGGVGETISGLVDLPDFAVEISGKIVSSVTGDEDIKWNLWDGSVGTHVADGLWYDRFFGGRFVPENEKQAALVGMGTGVGDVASIAVIPFAFAKAGRARTLPPIGGKMFVLDVTATSTTAPFSVNAQLNELEEHRAMAAFDETLESLGVSSSSILAADTLEAKRELCDQTVSKQLSDWGAPKNELAEMTLEQKLEAYVDITGIAIRLFEQLPQENTAEQKPEAAVTVPAPAGP